MTYIQVNYCFELYMYILKISSKWFKIRSSFISTSQNLKMVLCGVLIGKVQLFDSIDLSSFHILSIIKQLHFSS